MNLPRIQALVAPLSAPIPSALGVAVQAYLYFVTQSWLLGWIAAIGAFAGIEAIGGASCYAVVKLHRQKNYGIEFFVSLAGIIAYIGSGYFVLHNTAILIFFILAPFSYFAYAILRNMQDEHAEKVNETEAQIRLIEAETRRINAETRKAKAAFNTPVQHVQNVVLNDVNAKKQAEKSANLEAVLGYLADNPGASLSAIGDYVGSSKATAKNYTDELIQAGRLHKNGQGWKVN